MLNRFFNLVAAGLLLSSSLALASSIDLGSLSNNGSAQYNGTDLELTSDFGQAGSAYIQTSYLFNSLTSFTAAFSWTSSGLGYDSNLCPPDGCNGDGGDGFALILQGTGPTALGDAGGNLAFYGGGVGGINPTPPNALAIGFDLFGFFCGVGNQICINDLNGTLASVSATPTLGDSSSRSFARFGWVTYDATSSDLSVYYSDTSTQPVLPVATLDITTQYGTTLDQVLGSHVYVGFGGGTGGARVTTDIHAFNFTVPEPASYILAGGALLVFCLARRRKPRGRLGVYR